MCWRRSELDWASDANGLESAPASGALSPPTCSLRGRLYKFHRVPIDWAAVPTVSPASRADEPALAFCGVSKVFPDGTVALSNVDLTIQPGEFVGIVGPSG